MIFLPLKGLERTAVQGKVLKQVNEERSHFFTLQELR